MTHHVWKLTVLLAVVVAFFVAGWVSFYMPEQELESSRGPFNVLGNIFLAVALFVWYWHDAAEHNFQRSRAWDIGIILVTWIVVLPWYLIKTRGTKGGLKSVGLFLAFIVFALLPAAVAGMWIGSQIGA